MSAISNKYAALGGASSFLGNPTTAETACPDGQGRFRHYQNGSIYWHPSTGAWSIKGAIRVHYSSLGWEKSFLGYPINDETKSTDNKGFYSYFQNGAIYWHPDTGAHEVHGTIRQRYNQLGAERSFLGYPTTDETATPDKIGRYNHFQGGSIYWHPDTGAHEVHGAIRQKYAALGWEKSFLGYPITNETTTPDGVGKFNHFQDGSIYWHPNIGAYEVHGKIKSMWAINGWEKRFGYPLTDETTMNQTDNGRYNTFQNGYVLWTPAMGAWVDFCGNNEGRYQGTISLYKDANYKGTNAAFNVRNQCPIIFNQDLRNKGLHDNITAIKLQNIPNSNSVYFYENHDFTGRYIRITGDNINIPNIGGHMNDKISSAIVVNHGYGSLVFSKMELQKLIRESIKNPSVSGINWDSNKLFEVKMSPGTNCIKVCLYGTITNTWPDSEVRIEIAFRPYIAGEHDIRVFYAGFYAYSGGSFAGYANSTILGKIKDYINNNQAAFVNDFNKALADKTKDFTKVPASIKASINMRRINILPDSIELVICDNKTIGSLIAAAGISNSSTSRPSGQITNGTL